MLHLHRLHDRERLACFDLLVNGAKDLNDLPRHRREVAAFDALGARLGETRQLTDLKGVAVHQEVNAIVAPLEARAATSIARDEAKLLAIECDQPRLMIGIAEGETIEAGALIEPIGDLNALITKSELDPLAALGVISKAGGDAARRARERTPSRLAERERRPNEGVAHRLFAWRRPQRLAELALDEMRIEIARGEGRIV